MDKLLGKEIIAYGAGSAFRNYILNCKHEVNIKFKYVIDNKINEKKIYNIPVFKSDILKHEHRENIFIIIFALSSFVLQSISEELITFGFEKEVNFSDYSFLIKENFKSKLLSFGLSIKDNDYYFVKSLFYNLSIENQSSILGTQLFLTLLRDTKIFDDDIVELGVYKGGNAYFTSLFKNIIQDSRHYYLIDTFEGFPELSNFDPSNLSNMFKDNSFQRIETLFSDFPNVKVVKGKIPDILQEFDNKNFSLIYCDCDLYKPTLDSLNYFYPKLCRGGVYSNTRL